MDIARYLIDQNADLLLHDLVIFISKKVAISNVFDSLFMIYSRMEKRFLIMLMSI